MDTLTNESINKVLGIDEVKPEETQEPVEEVTEATPEAAPEENVEAVEEKPEPQKEPKKELRLDKHPRFIRLQQELSEMREWRQKQEEAAKQAPQPQEEVKQQAMPEAFTKLFGSNEEAWMEWQKLGLMTKEDAQAMTKQLIQQSFEEQREQARKVEEAQTQAIQHIEGIFSDISERTGLDLSPGTNRNIVLDFIERRNIYDANGLPNVELAYELLDEMGKFTPSTDIVEEKKRVVAKTAVKTNSNTQESEIMTPSKLRAIDKRGGLKSLLR